MSNIRARDTSELHHITEYITRGHAWVVLVRTRIDALFRECQRLGDNFEIVLRQPLDRYQRIVALTGVGFYDGMRFAYTEDVDIVQDNTLAALEHVLVRMRDLLKKHDPDAQLRPGFDPVPPYHKSGGAGPSNTAPEHAEDCEGCERCTYEPPPMQPEVTKAMLREGTIARDRIDRHFYRMRVGARTS